MACSIRHISKQHWESIIGDREIVGPGIDTSPTYFDNEMYPCPAVRFQANSPYIQALKEKEKCDWRNLTIEEKKCLYRASFCQTFSEFRAHTGEWKSILGFILLFVGVTFWNVMFIKTFFLNPMPESFSLERIRWLYRHLLNIEAAPIEGFSSLWDYENKKWKNGYIDAFYNGEEPEE